MSRAAERTPISISHVNPVAPTADNGRLIRGKYTFLMRDPLEVIDAMPWFTTRVKNIQGSRPDMSHSG
jgi:hypothetical protein